MLEIVVTTTEMYLLKRSNLFKEKDIIGFCVMSSYGNLNEIDNKEKRKICNQIFNVGEDFEILNHKLLNHNSVRIWYCSNDSEYVCNMYFLVNYLKKYNVEINVCDTYKINYQHLSSYMENEITDLLNNTRKLTNIEINEICKKWKTLSSENKDLRILNNGNIKSYSFDYLDNKILNLLSKLGSISLYKLIGLCMKNEICNYYCDFIFEDRINSLIEQNRIKIDKIVKEKNIINEDIIRKYISINNDINN